MNYLDSIITVNSYRGHKINQFNVDGGALIQGSNGAGKTSILRLVLLFFGASAKEIASISGKNNRFADYYLPSTSSYLVYQYKKENKDLMVIAFAKNRNEVTYYFCEGLFDEALFVNEAGQFIDCSEIKSHIQSMTKRKVSPAFSWSQYKQVIQSGKRIIGRDRDSQKINEAKLKFSLCGPNQSLDNIERIAISILANKPSFHAIRSLIADGILGLDSILKEDYGTSFDSKHLIQQQNLLRQAKRFKEEQPVLDDIRTAASLMKKWEQEKSILGDLILQSWQHYSEQLQQLTSDRNKLIHERDEVIDAQNDQIQQLSSQIGERKGEVKSQTSRLENLDKKHEDYHQNGIEKKQQLVKQLPHLAEQIASIRAEKETLESNFQHITKQYEVAASKAENRKLKQREELRSVYDQQLQQLDQQERELTDQKLKKQAQIYERFTVRREELNKKLSKREAYIKEVELKIQQPSSYSTEQIESDLNSIQKKLNDHEQNHTQLLQAINQLQAKENSAQRQRGAELTELERINSTVAKLNQRLDENRDDMKHLEQTFYYQLNALSSEKAELAARVLRIDVLKAPLKYQLEIIESDHGLLGLNIDFTQFPAQLIPDKAELQKQAAEIGQELQALVTSKTETENKIQSLNQDLEKYKKQQAEFDQQLKILMADKNRLKKRLSEQRQNLEVEKKNLISDLQAEADKIQEEIDALQVEKQSLDRDQKAQIEREQTQFDEQMTKLSQQRAAAKSHYDAECKRLDDATEQELRRINQAKNKELSDAGARAEEIDKLEQRLRELNEQHSLVVEAEKEVEKYQIWYESEYSVRPQIEHTIAELTSKLEQLNFQHSEMLVSLDEEQENFKKSLDVLSKKLDDCDHEVKTFNNLLENYYQRDSLTVKEGDTILVAKMAREQLEGLIKNIEAQNKKGEEGYNSFLYALRNRDNQELSECLRELLIENGLSEIDSTQNWRDLIDSLTYVMKTIDGLITAAQQEFDTIAGDIIGLDAKLDTISQRIVERGRSISNKLNQAGTEFSNIESIKANISSNIENLGYRKALRQAAEEARKVQILPAHEEIPESYFDKLSWALEQIERYGRGMKLEQFIDVELVVKNTGIIQLRRARNDKELKDISSEGLSFLILIALYMAIKNTFGESQNVKLVWAIDEIGKLHPDNIEILMNILKAERVDFFCAEPRTDPQILSQFKHIYEITESGKIIKVESDMPKTAGAAFLEVAGG